MKIFSDRINQLHSFTSPPPFTHKHSRCHHLKRKTFKLWFLDSWPDRKNTKNQPAFIVEHHHPRHPTVILMFPSAPTASLEMTWELNPNANTLRENQLAEGELQSMLSCFFFSSGKSTCGRRLCSQSRSWAFSRRASPVLLPQWSGALWCGDGRCCSALPEAGLQQRADTEREPNPLSVCFMYSLHIITPVLL